MQSSSQSEGQPRPILKYNAPELRQVCRAFDWSDPEHLRGLADLRATLIDSPRARGLAANQIGFLARAFVMRYQGTVLDCVNPFIVSARPDIEVEAEGCMSYPNLTVKVPRPCMGTVRFEHAPGEETTICDMDGWDFRCFLHELDHLNGITIDIIRRRSRS